MRQPVIIYLVLVILCIAETCQSAETVAQSRPSSYFDSAEVIVLASLEGYKPGGAHVAEPSLGKLERLVEDLTIHEPGNYRFRTIHIFKGEFAQESELWLPRVSAYFYGRNKFDLSQGRQVLLRLKKGPDGQYQPTDPLVPLVPVSVPKEAFEAGKGDPIKDFDALDILLQSLDDSELRPPLMNFLRPVVDPRMLKVIRNYSDDKNLSVRADALSSLAVNQDITAIPKIISWAHEGGPAPVDALAKYSVRTAVPLLNPLIADKSESVRINAMIALRPMADESSIPFLMIALEEDGGQDMVAYNAYYVLHQLIGRSIPPALSVPQFLERKDAEIRILKQWWEWEQIKQKAAETARNPAIQADATSTPVPDLVKVGSQDAPPSATMSH